MLDAGRRAQEFKHIDGLIVTSDIETVSGVTFRYRLDVSRSDGTETGQTICVVMQNPSVADAELSDKTMKKLETAIFSKSYPTAFQRASRLIVVNQFAKVQTSGFCGTNDEIGPRNDAAIARAFDEANVIVIGWGATNTFYERQRAILQRLTSLSNKTFLRIPKHPSLAAYEDFFVPLMIDYELVALEKKLHQSI